MEAPGFPSLNGAAVGKHVNFSELPQYSVCVKWAQGSLASRAHVQMRREGVCRMLPGVSGQCWVRGSVGDSVSSRLSCWAEGLPSLRLLASPGLPDAE